MHRCDMLVAIFHCDYILWSTHRGIKFLDHGAWSRRTLGGSIGPHEAWLTFWISLGLINTRNWWVHSGRCIWWSTNGGYEVSWPLTVESQLNISIARCILWSTHRGMNFLDHGAWSCQTLGGSVGHMNHLCTNNVWSQRGLGGSIARKDKLPTECIQLD